MAVRDPSDCVNEESSLRMSMRIVWNYSDGAMPVLALPVCGCLLLKTPCISTRAMFYPVHLCWRDKCKIFEMLRLHRIFPQFEGLRVINEMHHWAFQNIGISNLAGMSLPEQFHEFAKPWSFEKCGALFTTLVDNFALPKIASNCDAQSSLDR